MKSEITVNPDRSWLHGKYDTEYGKAEIDIFYSTVFIEGFFSEGDLFAQGDEADSIIEDIHQYWVAGDLTQLEALEKYINNYGY